MFFGGFPFTFGGSTFGATPAFSFGIAPSGFGFPFGFPFGGFGGFGFPFGGFGGFGFPFGGAV